MSLPSSTSVILVSFYTGDILFTSIAAVLNQTAPIELIIVNNGNPTNVVERLHNLATTDTRIRVMTGHGNIGFGSGVNIGAATASGSYLLVLNPDCLLNEDTVQRLLQQAATLRSPFMVGARILNKDGTDQRGCRRELLTPMTAFIEALHLGRFFPRYRLNRHEENIPTKLTPIPAISGAFMFLPHKDFDLIKGFDKSFFLHVEDLDFCFRFRRAKGEIYFAPDIPVTHIGGTSDTTSDFIERHKARGFVRYFHNNFKDQCPVAFLWCLDLAIWGRYFLRRLLAQIGR